MQINKFKNYYKGMRYLIFTAMLFFLWQCANVVAPKGGPKDEIPPKLITEESTPNLKTNFTKQDIVFEFDEWIELNDVFNQIVISPPIDKKDYEIKIKGKSVVFHFKESAELRENATYTINFGEGVRDITERNPAENLRYVFSTGDYIDSLMVSGKLVDALTGAPVEDAFFMLYENLADSVVRKSNPFYFGKTNESGTFLIQNVRAGTFKGFAIKRVDQDYKFNNPAELIGFPEQFIVVGDTTGVAKDSLGNPIMQAVNVPTIKLFQEAQPNYITDVDTSRFGYVNLIFNTPPKNINLTFNDLEAQPISDYQADSLHIWYDQVESGSWELLVQKDSLLNDTLTIGPKNKRNYLETGKLTYHPGLSTKKGKFNPSNPIVAAFTNPLSAFDTSFIKLRADTTLTLVQPTFTIDSTNQRKLNINHSWKGALPYVLEILPGGVEDIFGLKNQDTIKMAYSADLKKSFGNISIDISGLDDKLSYLGEILDKNDRVIHTFSVSDSPGKVVKLEAIPPGEYRIKIITDLNNNGEWDTGEYDAKRQPEPIFEKQLEKLRANWDVEAEVNPED